MRRVIRVGLAKWLLRIDRRLLCAPSRDEVGGTLERLKKAPIQRNAIVALLRAVLSRCPIARSHILDSAGRDFEVAREQVRVDLSGGDIAIGTLEYVGSEYMSSHETRFQDQHASVRANQSFFEYAFQLHLHDFLRVE
jgi:hypothetical protein